MSEQGVTQITQINGQEQLILPPTEAPGAENLKEQRKKKFIRPRSEAWKEFTKFKDQEGHEKARCNFCKKEFFADSSRNGTTNLRAHMTKCKGKEEKKISIIVF
jgi:BED zinc finger